MRELPKPDTVYEQNPTMEIITTREFSVPAQALFAAFSNPENLAQWWGPDGFSNEFHIFDFCEGGEWDFTMRTDGFPDFHNQSRFMNIHEPHHISFLHLGPIHVFTMLMDYAPTQTGTRLTWTMQMEDTPQNQDIKHFIEAANEQNFDRLEQFISQ
jgi:uncharacterized protein YndB with AHSA1/START domain